MSFRFVYFDLDDTLLDHRHAERAALAELCEAHEALGAHEVAHVQETYHTHNVPLWKAYAAGDLAKDDLKRLRFERLLEALAVDDLEADALGADYLARYARHWQLIDGADEAFEAIAAHLPVGILTNGFIEVQAAKLERFPRFQERSQVVVVSEEVGHLKPHPKLFAHATARAGVAPETILYVGDSYHSDVRGARAAGWQAAWFTTAAEPEEEGVFRFDRWEVLVDWVTGAMV